MPKKNTPKINNTSTKSPSKTHKDTKQGSPKMNIDNFSIDNYRKNRDAYKFYTEYSKDINMDLVRFAEANLDRIAVIGKINNILKTSEFSDQIENGIFEYSLLKITTSKLSYKFIIPVYDDKANEIILNLDPNSYIKNKSLASTLLGGMIKPQMIAFLSPQQLHPLVWGPILEKRHRILALESDVVTSDLYKCYKCGERKCSVTEMQIRSADEPTNLFITCLVCYSTFIR